VCADGEVYARAVVEEGAAVGLVRGNDPADAARPFGQPQLSAEGQQRPDIDVGAELVVDGEEGLAGADGLDGGRQQEAFAVEVACAGADLERAGADGLRGGAEVEVEVELLARLEGRLGERPRAGDGGGARR
jgi:hypothetical protein